MFVGFGDSGVRTDVIENITQGKHIIQVDFKYMKSKDEPIPHRGVFKDPVTSGDLVVFPVEVYIPWIDVDTNIDWNFRDVVRQMNSTIDHELGHFVQEIGIVRFRGKIEDNSRKFGYPPRKLLNKVPGSKTQTAPEYKQTGQWAHPHELRDTEFYTRLRDVKVRIEEVLIDPKTYKFNRDPYVENLSNFRLMVGVDPTGYKDGFVVSYREIDPWLDYLKKNDSGKWNKAVKELYKELEYYLVRS